ncbi:hypothetical protein AAEX28_02450 [Lentisphaerota bacterium WC36G]|nr:hypothetical protein LJT99_05335 [Lentisphaerae bacterium WC36]
MSMINKFARYSGKVSLKTTEYLKGKPVFTEHPCKYFSKDSSHRNDAGELIVDTFYYLVDLGHIDLTTSSKFVDKDNKEFTINSVQRKDNPFKNEHICYKITVG